MSRRSKQREGVLKVLNGEAGHPGAQWIYEQVRLKMPRISLGTVYRDLKALTADGQISEISDGNECRFDPVPGNHYHFHCDRCGLILNLDGAPDDKINNEAVRKYKLRITGHRLDYFGLCTVCEGGPVKGNDDGRRK